MRGCGVKIIKTDSQELNVFTGEDVLVEVDVFAVFVGFNQLLDDISNGHHHQLSPAEIT